MKRGLVLLSLTLASFGLTNCKDNSRMAEDLELVSQEVDQKEIIKVATSLAPINLGTDDSDFDKKGGEDDFRAVDGTISKPQIKLTGDLRTGTHLKLALIVSRARGAYELVSRSELDFVYDQDKNTFLCATQSLELGDLPLEKNEEYAACLMLRGDGDDENEFHADQVLVLDKGKTKLVVKGTQVEGNTDPMIQIPYASPWYKLKVRYDNNDKANLALVDANGDKIETVRIKPLGYLMNLRFKNAAQNQIVFDRGYKIKAGQGFSPSVRMVLNKPNVGYYPQFVRNDADLVEADGYIRISLPKPVSLAPGEGHGMEYDGINPDGTAKWKPISGQSETDVHLVWVAKTNNDQARGTFSASVYDQIDVLALNGRYSPLKRHFKIKCEKTAREGGFLNARLNFSGDHVVPIPAEPITLVYPRNMVNDGRNQYEKTQAELSIPNGEVSKMGVTLGEFDSRGGGYLNGHEKHMPYIEDMMSIFPMSYNGVEGYTGGEADVQRLSGQGVQWFYNTTEEPMKVVTERIAVYNTLPAISGHPTWDKTSPRYEDYLKEYFIYKKNSLNTRVVGEFNPRYKRVYKNIKAYYKHGGRKAVNPSDNANSVGNTVLYALRYVGVEGNNHRSLWRYSIDKYPHIGTFGLTVECIYLGNDKDYQDVYKEIGVDSPEAFRQKSVEELEATFIDAKRYREVNVRYFPINSDKNPNKDFSYVVRKRYASETYLPATGNDKHEVTRSYMLNFGISRNANSYHNSRKGQIWFSEVNSGMLNYGIYEKRWGKLKRVRTVWKDYPSEGKGCIRLWGKRQMNFEEYIK